MQGIELGSAAWKASTLTTVGSLLPLKFIFYLYPLLSSFFFLVEGSFGPHPVVPKSNPNKPQSRKELYLLHIFQLHSFLSFTITKLLEFSQCPLPLLLQYFPSMKSSIVQTYLAHYPFLEGEIFSTHLEIQLIYVKDPTPLHQRPQFFWDCYITTHTRHTPALLLTPREQRYPLRKIQTKLA